MNKEQSADQDVKDTAAVDSEHQECQDTNVVNVPEEEVMRHDLFHAAVKRVLEQHGRTLNVTMRITDVKDSRYQILLTSSELKFLLK